MGYMSLKILKYQSHDHTVQRAIVDFGAVTGSFRANQIQFQRCPEKESFQD